MARLIGLLLVVVTACGNITRKQDDAGVRDDAPRDSSMSDMNMITQDAAVDALVIPPTEAREITSGGTRMTGGGFTFDVQIGHPVQQKKATGGGYTIQGNTAVKP